jgi:hypothetical protein
MFAKLETVAMPPTVTDVAETPWDGSLLFPELDELLFEPPLVVVEDFGVLLQAAKSAAAASSIKVALAGLRILMCFILSERQQDAIGVPLNGSFFPRSCDSAR